MVQVQVKSSGLLAFFYEKSAAMSSKRVPAAWDFALTFRRCRC